MEIRSATSGDAETIAAIYSYYVEHTAATFETEAPAAREMEQRRLTVLAQKLPYLVVEVDSQVAGFAYAGLYRIRPAYRFTVEDSIYLDVRFTGRGLGRALLTRLMDLCAADGRREMVAIVGDSLNAASVGLHLSLGFRRVGVLEGVGWKLGRWVDTVILQKSLR